MASKILFSVSGGLFVKLLGSHINYTFIFNTERVSLRAIVYTSNCGKFDS